MINSLNIYEGEIIKRGPMWYIIFISVSIFLVFFSFFRGGLMGGVSVLFIFAIIMVAYIFVHLISIKKTILEIHEGFFKIKDKTIPYSDILGYNIEYDQDGKYRNFIIVPLSTQYPSRYTINESDQSKVVEIIETLQNLNLNIYSDYENDKINQIIRYLKLG